MALSSISDSQDRAESFWVTKLLIKDDARRIAANIAKLPELLRRARVTREAKEDWGADALSQVGWQIVTSGR